MDHKLPRELVVLLVALNRPQHDLILDRDLLLLPLLGLFYLAHLIHVHTEDTLTCVAHLSLHRLVLILILRGI